MKYINKKIQNEPRLLIQYRETTPNAAYAGFSDNDEGQHPLREALLKEQGYLCAYCMGRISLDLNEEDKANPRKQRKPKVEVEHYLSQEQLQKHPKKGLNFNNLLAVCNGLSLTYPENEEIHHCDKTQGEKGKMNGTVRLGILNPLNIECEELIKYTPGGEILSKSNNADVTHDLEKVLNLNNKVLKRNRKTVIENATKKMIKERPSKQWSKAFLQKHLNQWKEINNGKFRQYCMIAVWFIETLLSKTKYK